jgi:hypothetical protein
LVTAEQKKYMQLATWALDASANVELSSNEMLWGFEADIVIQCTMVQMLPMPCPRQPRGTKHIVEIDGPRRAYARKRGFTQRRDEHTCAWLTACEVVRWDLMSEQRRREGTMRSCRTFEI